MIDNLNDAKEQIKDYFADKKELNEALEADEPADIINEIADSNCDIYTYDLMKWVGEGNNYQHIEDAISEFGFPKSDGKPDFIKAIMAGQFYANNELLNEAWGEMVKAKAKLDEESPDYLDRTMLEDDALV